MFMRYAEGSPLEIFKHVRLFLLDTVQAARYNVWCMDDLRKPQSKVVPVEPDPGEVQRMWIGKVSANAFAIGVPIPVEVGAAAGIFPGGAFVAIRRIGRCVVLCPVESVAQGDVQREADQTLRAAIAEWKQGVSSKPETRNGSR
jgi:hypothetical protein